MAQVVARYVNDNGGLNGHPVRVIVADDGGDPARALSLVRDLVENQSAVAFMGQSAATPGGCRVAAGTPHEAAAASASTAVERIRRRVPRASKIGGCISSILTPIRKPRTKPTPRKPPSSKVTNSIVSLFAWWAALIVQPISPIGLR